MRGKPKTHLPLHSNYIYVGNPYTKENATQVAEALFEETKGLPEPLIMTPVYFSPDKKIYFHGGDFLPFSKLPMPWAGNEDWINQYPKTREVGFSPLFNFLISKELYDKLNLPAYFDDNIITHAEFIMRAKEYGAKIYTTPNVHIIYPNAYKPVMGKKKFYKVVSRDLARFDEKWGNTLDSRFRLPVVLHTIVSYAGGYNLHSYNVAKSLFEAGIRVYYHFIGGTNEDEPESECPFIDDYKTRYGSNKLPQITICHGTANFKNSGSYKIAFSTTEVDGIPPDWTDCFNEMDEVWTTSEFAAKSFKNSGVRTPIYVIGEGVDPNYFHPEIAPFFNSPKQKFRFVSNFAWGRRKGVDILFEAFRREFDEDEDVCLMLKVLPSYQGHKIKDELKLLYERKGSAPIYLYDITMPKWEIARFYRMGHAFIWPSRGEGYGLPALEALACGLPVIATNYSAHLEFLTKNGQPRDGVELVDGKLKPYPGGDSIYYHGFNWFEPSVDDLRKKMRKVYENYEKYKEGALKSSEEVRKEFDWQVSTKKIIERLEDIYQNKLFKKR